MNEQAILHIPDSRYCFPITEKEVVLRLRVDRRDPVDGVQVVYESKYVIQMRQLDERMERRYEDRLFAWYEVKSGIILRTGCAIPMTFLWHILIFFSFLTSIRQIYTGKCPG